MPSWRAGSRLELATNPRSVPPQWGHDVAVVEGSSWGSALGPLTTCRRNGATTLPSWRVKAGDAIPAHTLAPQWGHDVAVVEGASVRDARPRASWQCRNGHDVAVVEGGRWTLPQATGQAPQWGHDVAVVEGLMVAILLLAIGNAAMGPRRCRRGGEFVLDQDVAKQAALPPWGHDVAVVEGTAGFAPVPTPVNPPQWGHDVAVVEGTGALVV